MNCVCFVGVFCVVSFVAVFLYCVAVYSLCTSYVFNVCVFGLSMF